MLSIIGENLHCSRLRLKQGKHCRVAGSKTYLLWKNAADEEESFVVPAAYDGDRIRHVAAALDAVMKTNDLQAEAYLQHVVRQQERAGASFIDVNVDEYTSSPETNETAMLFLLEKILPWTTLPLAIDSSSASLLTAGARLLRDAGRDFLLNSASEERPEILALADACGASVVLSAAGQLLPSDAVDRLTSLRPLLARARSLSIADSRLYLDPLVLPVSVDVNHGPGFLEACRLLREEFGSEIHLAGGISNVSFGLPQRPLLNVCFLRLAEARGLDAPIFDPLQQHLPPELPSELVQAAEDVLLGKDEFALNFLELARGHAAGGQL